ncbi:YraN family protein [Lolliginicoccus levis]|uniref:YraN family protein n=1 Tax=Lolliginicoccus levis TaxID=2919542 RepID=UPI00241E6833|nr:YraN family protein [Lolliginicoccus levis]
MPHQPHSSPVHAGANLIARRPDPGQAPQSERSGDHPARARHAGARALGSTGEDLAAAYLINLGYQVIARNWRCVQGELDLICLDTGGSLVMVEVKTRATDLHGHPCEMVTPVKARRMREAARHWLVAHEWRRGAIRFDIVGIIAHPGDSALPDITHLKDVC